MAGLGRKAVQGIAAGIGLVSEARAARKTKKQNQQEQSRELPAAPKLDTAKPDLVTSMHWTNLIELYY